MNPRAVTEGLRRGWAVTIVLVAVLCAAPAAFGAGALTLSNLRLEPDPVEAYGRMTLRVDFSNAQAPVARLWVRLVREGRQGDPAAHEMGPGGAPGPSGTLVRWIEMGEPGPRHLSLVAEDARGERSVPLELRFSVVEPSRRYEEVTYLSDGLKIKGYIYRPPGPGPFPAIIYSHGSFVRGDMAQPHRYEWLAYRLARSSYLTFVAERRGYGGSEGEGVVGGEGLNNLRYGLPGEVKDLVSAIEFLKARPEVDSRRIALVGKSLGGFVSLMAAAERPDLRAVISLAGGYGFGDRSMGPVMLFVQSELQGAARRIKVSTLLMHAENDRIVPVQFSRMVYEELKQRGIPAVAKIYPPFKVAGKEREGHALFDGVDGFSYFRNDLTGFLAEALRP
jgi:carboxymethylenebutenolidase